MGWCAQQGVPNNAISVPKLANFWCIYDGLAWPGIQLVYIILLFKLFWSHIIFTRLLIILSSLNEYVIFIYSVLLINALILGMLNVCYLCRRVGHQLLSLPLKLAWKTANLLALVTVKHCSYLTILCIDNQHLFLQHHAAIFIPMSGGKTDHTVHLPPQIHIESHSNVKFALLFI